MRKTTLRQLFQMGYPALLVLIDNCLYLIDRDAAIYLLFGVGDETKDFLTDNGDLLRAFRTDEEYLGDMSDATATRDITADKVKVAIRDVMLRPRMIFGEHTAKYRSFGTLGMDAMDDKELLHCSERVVRAANQYLDLLEPAGLTQAIVDSLEALSVTYREHINLKNDAVYIRDIATEARLELGNKLYNKIVILYDIGKTYWADKSEAKYNDYVIYNTPTGAPPTPGATCDAHGTVTDGVTHQPITTALGLFDGLAAPATMDSEGKWEAKKIPLTTLLARFMAAGYINHVQAINLVEGGDVELNIELMPGGNQPPPTP